MEIISKLEDRKFCENIIDNDYRDIILNEEYWIENFVDKFNELIKEADSIIMH